MPFSFFNPWIWLGALAVGVPIWLHLRRRREKRVVRFSAVAFLDDQPVASRQPMRLRNLVLFACRVLALLLVIAAFAWPYWRHPNTIALRESRVYILDNTLSRQAASGFQKDRDRLAQELAALSPEVQFAVIELKSMPAVIASFGDNGQAASARVRNIQPSFERGSYLAAFRQAADLLANSLGAKKRIILLGDNQANQWTENVNSLPFIRDTEVQLPSRPAERLANVSLSEPRAQRVLGADKSLVDFTVKLTRMGEPRKVKLRVRADDRVVLERELEPMDGTVLLQAQWEADASHWLRGTAELEGASDALGEDNKVFFACPPVEEGRVLVMARSSYLRVALSPEIMRGRWAARNIDVSGAAAELSGRTRDDVLLLESGYLQSGEARDLVSQYLEAGRGVVLVLDRVTQGIDAFLRALEFEVEGSVRPSEPERFQTVASSHRIFHPFSSPDYGNLLEVNVRRYFRLRAQRASPLLFSERGEPMLFEATRERGKLFVVAFGLDREYSSWPVHPTFIPFLDLLLRAASAEESVRDSFEPGESWPVEATPGSGGQVVISGGGKEARSELQDGRAEIRVPELPGVYEVTQPGKPARLISVNPSPKESELVYAESPEALAAWKVGPTERAKVPRVPVSTAAILQQRYWWWMLVGGLLALMAEMALLVRARPA